MKPNKADYTPMMQQYLTIKEDHPDKIVLFRLGDFYEMFFDDAILASRELEIALTGRDAGHTERVPMCGVPHHAVTGYLEELVQKGHKVAIVEQTEDATLAKGLVKRDVVKIVTPGTYFHETGRDDHFLAAISFSNPIQVVLADISTGQTLAWNTADETSLMRELGRYRVKEVVIRDASEVFLEYLNRENIYISYQIQDVDTFTDERVKDAEQLLFSYLNETQKMSLAHIKELTWIEHNKQMRMDLFTLKNLEVLETLRTGTNKGTLLWYLDSCVTAMGSRYLKKELIAPLLSEEVLNKRYDFVEELKREFLLREEIKTVLQTVYDLERIVGRISYKNATAKDFVQLKRSLSELPLLKDMLSRFKSDLATELTSVFDPRTDLFDLIDSAIVDDPPLTITSGGLFKEGYHARLDELNKITKDTKDYLKELEIKERERTGISKLKIGYNRVFGYYVEVTKGQLDKVTEDFGYERKQTLANAERYISEELKQLEQTILNAYHELETLEYELFVSFRDGFILEIPSLQRLSEQISSIDFFYALSLVAEKHKLTRPTFGSDLKIKEGRHPILEELLKEHYVTNDCEMGPDTGILLITGPNMSGKSTYMRMVANIAILAQIGSFVPADEAVLPIFDAIYTRIGAADDLMLGQSTFMVEMLEVNHALANATSESLILFDEIGRGTATFDGLALAQSILEYIHKEVKAKTLFSTHYHELVTLEEHLGTLKNVHVAAKEGKDGLTFYHKVKPGAVDKSYGIHVAKLADLPNDVTKRARELLKELEQTKVSDISLFNQVEETFHPAIEKLKLIDVNDMTPMEALKLLAELKEEV